MSDSSFDIYHIQPLTGVENYFIWKIRMSDILSDMGLYEYALGAVEEPEDESAAADWAKKDRKALSAIRFRVGDGPLVYISDAETSASAWTTLSNIYLPQDTVQVRQKIFRAQCHDSGDINEHIRTMIRHRKELAF